MDFFVFLAVIVVVVVLAARSDPNGKAAKLVQWVTVSGAAIIAAALAFFQNGGG